MVKIYKIIIHNNINVYQVQITYSFLMLNGLIKLEIDNWH